SYMKHRTTRGGTLKMHGVGLKICDDVPPPMQIGRALAAVFISPAPFAALFVHLTGSRFMPETSTTLSAAPPALLRKLDEMSARYDELQNSLNDQAFVSDHQKVIAA